MALLSMRDVSIGFGGSLVLEGINLQIERGERLGLLGRNGVGKSTLLKIIAGDLQPDEGTVVRQQGLRVAYLVQEVPQGLQGTVYEVVGSGLEALSPISGDEAPPLMPMSPWRRTIGCSSIAGLGRVMVILSMRTPKRFGGLAPAPTVMSMLLWRAPLSSRLRAK